MQHGPLFFDSHSRRAEEQWAFHEKYHDRMARLTGGGVGGREDVRGDSREPRSAPDYWVNYAKKLEDMGLPRGDGNAVLHGSADARTRSPQLPPCGNYVSPPDRHYAPRHWEPTSVTKSPAHMSREENVLHRLDWFAQEKSEPDAADVFDLLREAEDVLARQESRRRDEAAHPAEYSQPPARISSSNLLPTHHGRDRGRPMGVPDSAPPHAVSSNGDLNITGGAGRYRTAPSSPPPATTPTVPPFLSMSQSAQPGQPSAGTNWSQISWCQQMEWYRTYYAWMMYYAQYYGAFLASKQQQQEHEKHHHYNHQKQKERSHRKKMNKEKTGLEELSREYRELATEVERLGQSIGNHGVTAKHVHPHSSRHMAGDDEYTLYRSDNCHSLLRGPNPFSFSRDGGPAVSMSRPGLRVPVRQEYLNVKDEFAQEAHASNTSQDSKVLHSGQSHRSWLSQRCPSPEEDHKAGGAFKRPIHRDISRPYKYEARGDTREKLQTDTEGGRNWDYDDSDRRRLDVPLNEKGRMPSRLQRQKHVQEQEHVHPKEPRLSIYERKRRELEREKPRWCF